MNNPNGDLQCPVTQVRVMQDGEHPPPVMLYSRYADSAVAGFFRDLVVKFATKSGSPALATKMAEAVVDEAYRTLLRREWVSEIPSFDEAMHRHVHN